MKLFSPADPGYLAIIALLLAWTPAPASAAHRDSAPILTLSIESGEPEIMDRENSSVLPIWITLETMTTKIDFASCPSVLQAAEGDELRSLKTIDRDAMASLCEQTHDEPSTMLGLIQRLDR